MVTELYIEGHRLDITKEISALLTFSIDDIKRFAERSTTYSKTIVLPGTSKNNKIFGHIFQIGQANPYNNQLPNVALNFNASKSAKCVLFQDQLQTFNGVLRLLQINYFNGLNGRVEYEVSIFGNLSGLNSVLTGKLLEQLDFSAHNHEFSVSNISNSWTNASGSGYYYPLIDYGNASVAKHDWDVKTFRAAFFAKEYVDKIFNTSGYRYNCPLFSTPRFQKLVVPHNQKEVRVNNSVVGRGGLTADPGYDFLLNDGDPDHTILFNAVPFNDFSSPIFTASNIGGLSGWPFPNHFTYTDTPSVTLRLKYTVQGRHFGDNGFRFSVNKNGDAVNGAIQSTVVDIPGTGPNNTTYVPFLIQGQVDISFNQNDYFEMWLYHDPVGMWDVRLELTNLEITSATGSNILVPIQLGQTVICNDLIPKNIRQIDFLVWIVGLFNLYVYEDKNDPSLIHITPYIDYYSKNFSNAEDWTQKLDRKKAIKVKPMSEINAKIYKFKFKSDSDFYSELYRKRYNEGYGDRIYDSQFEFSASTNELEIGFSSTVLVGYNGEDKVYSTIFKRTGVEPSTTEESVDSNIRLLQTARIQNVSSWSIKNAETAIGTFTSYGYAGHLDHPTIPTNDLNFGATRELFYVLTSGTLQNNQFNVYWSSYMAEITNKDSKLVTAYFKLDIKDILNIDFSKYINIDGVAFRLNQIKDYNVTKPGVCVVELLKVNSASYTEAEPPTSGPDGCFLLWSDNNILDWDTSEPLTYSDCEDNPGDGEDPEPPVGKVLNWQWSRPNGVAGSIRIRLNNVIVVNNDTTSGSGSFSINNGDEIRVRVAGFSIFPKHIQVSNDVDGQIFNDSDSGASFEYVFQIEANKNYNVVGAITND